MSDEKPKLVRATHEGILTLGAVAIPCAVLENGQRILTQSGMMTALGRARQAKGRQYYDADVNMPAFLTAKNLKPFISKELEVTSSQLQFRTHRGTRAFGYPAEILPRICDVFLDAEEAGALTVAQKHIAQRAKLLIRGLAHVGIVALVDEATGYQEERNREELQRILAAYIAPELMPYTNRFPEEFWRNMFRLRGWHYQSLASGKTSPKGPRYAGKLTDELIYKKLPPGVREELRKKSPSNEKSQRKHKLYRFLTEDVGDPHLTKQVAIVTTLMKVSNSWRGFRSLFERAFADPNARAQRSLFPELDEDEE